jgi:hypothetical protein
VHRILSGAVKCHVVDDGADHHTAPHELADRLANVVVIAAEPINPANDKHITGPQLIE